MPRRFGRYEVQQEIGEGAMGRVYRCFDPMMRRVVAVKTVKKEFLTRDTRDEYLRRFRREAQAAGRLAHPNIVSVFDVADDYFVMEYLEGSTLQLILRDRGQVPVEEAVRIVGPLADALDYAHRSGVIHRDIKPGNVFVLADGRPKLMDFGVAHLETSAMTAQGHFFGSPSYMAPEQVSGGPITAAADLFSLAVVAYEMVTGHRPFEGASITAIMYRVVNEEPPAPRQWDFDLPSVYDDIFRRALSKHAIERFPDAVSLARALERREYTPPPSDPLAELEETLRPAAAHALAAAVGGPSTPTSSAASTPVPPAVSTPVSPSLLGVLETQDLQTALAQAAADRRPRHRRTVAWAALAAFAGLIVLYLGRGTDGTPLPPLPAAPSQLRIESEPAGAAVWFDGEEVGDRTPVMLRRVRPGTHLVRVAADGYAPANLTLVTRGGEPLPPLRFVMEPLTAVLRVRSDPTEAQVQVDGESVGTTPIESLALAPGRHEVRLERRGFVAASQVVEGKAGQTVEVSLRLSRRPETGSGPAPFHEVRRGDLIPLASADTPPTRLKGDAPSYPDEARKHGFQGTVAVDLLVDENGHVQDPHITESAGEVLDNAVLQTIRGWVYLPARKNGVDVKTRIQVKTTFQNS